MCHGQLFLAGPIQTESYLTGWDLKINGTLKKLEVMLMNIEFQFPVQRVSIAHQQYRHWALHSPVYLYSQIINKISIELYPCILIRTTSFGLCSSLNTSIFSLWNHLSSCITEQRLFNRFTGLLRNS